MKPEELTRRVAIFQSPYGGFIVCNHSDSDKDSTEYIRVSEPITVTFTARRQDEVIAAAVKEIDAQIVDAQIVDAQMAVRKLEMRKAELLALPAPESV